MNFIQLSLLYLVIHEKRGTFHSLGQTTTIWGRSNQQSTSIEVKYYNFYLIHGAINIM